MPSDNASSASTTSDALRLIKKYPNRRLYDTRSSAYITLADVKQLVLNGEEFVVADAKSGEDLTRSILLQIILEEESGGVPMFTSNMLSQIIRYYGHAMQGVMGSYLERNIQAFIELQGTFQEQSKALFEGKGMATPELWAQWLAGQQPVVQTMMSSYVEQTRTVMEQMQEHFQSQAKAMFPAFPFAPSGANAPAPAGSGKPAGPKVDPSK